MSQTSASKTEPEPQPEPARPRPWLTPLFALLIVVLGAVAYWPQLGNGFTNWDDNWLITENRWIREISVANTVTIFNPMAPQEIREELGNEYLPLRDLSYSLNYALDGYNPRGYQATNLLLHLLNSLLVMLLAARISRNALTGGLAGLLFSLHPVHVEAVSWLSSRKDLMATFFTLLAINLYWVARLPRAGLMPSQSFVQRLRQSVRLSYWLALLCFLAALLSKMHAVVLPALLLLLELFGRQRLGSATPARRAMMLLPFFGIAAMFTLLAMKIGSGLMREPYGDSLASTWFTAAAAITRDAQVLVMGTPLQACVDFELRPYVTPQVGAGMALLALMLAAGIGGWLALRRAQPSASQALLGWLGLGALWFLIALSPVSNFFVQIGTVFAERYLYLPSVGFCLTAAALATAAWERARRAAAPLNTAGSAALVLMAAALSVACIWQVSRTTLNWKDSETLWRSVLAHDPGNHTAYFNLGRELQERALSESDAKRREELLLAAEINYTNALNFEARTYRYDPARVYGALASVEIHRGKPAEALKLLDEAQARIDLPWRPQRGRDDIASILNNYRGLALSALGRHEEALAAFRRALASSRRYSSYRINLASELARAALNENSRALHQAVLDEAYAEIDAYERERGKDLLSTEARALILKKEFDLRLLLSGKGGEAAVPPELADLLKRAQGEYRRAVALREAEAPNAKAMATLLLAAAEAFLPGSPGDKNAEAFLRRALMLDPKREGLRYLLARLLQERDGREAKVEATRLLNEELELHPDFKPARSLRAAGVFQQALNELAGLYGAFAPEYTAAYPDIKKPTWTQMTRAFIKRDAYRSRLEKSVALFMEAAKWDSENPQLAEILNRSMVEGGREALALDLGRGLWFFGGEVGRAQAEALMRTAFNLMPVDGPMSRFLSGIYLELAEKAVRSSDRDELLKLIENMLQLSETARKQMSIRLINMGTDIDGGRKLSNVKDEEFDWSLVDAAERSRLVAELMRTALLLDPESIPALNWLKLYYEKEGELEEAIIIYLKFEKLLESKPDMLTGVRMALAQCQFDLGQRCVKDYRKYLDLDRERAGRFAGRAIEVFNDCVATCDRELKASSTPAGHLLRIKGLACQRLAYLDGGRAHYWYSLAIETYERAPLDFPDELSEVRRKRAWFTEDPYRRRDDLRRAISEAELQGKDAGALKEDLINVENRITLDETEALRRQGKLREALERMNAGFKVPNPALWRARADIEFELAQGAKAARDPEAYDLWIVKAAQDYVRAFSDPEALIKGGELYYGELALAMAEPETYNTKARVALEKAQRIIDEALVALTAGDSRRAQLEALSQRARKTLGQMQRLAQDLYRRADEALAGGREPQALELLARSLELQGENPQAWLLKAQAELSLARKSEGAERTRWAQEARASLESVIRNDPPLARQYLEAQLCMAEAWLMLGLKRDAAFWLDAAERRLAQALKDKRLTEADSGRFNERLATLRNLAR
ncbi:hypothetical protein EDM80_13095 [bacterium]|nr:MAG: hypothetical protein EDM80_13095 [bacterium]